MPNSEMLFLLFNLHSIDSMSARRNSKAERPEFMVSKYRQPIDTRRNQSKTIQRQKGSKPVTSVVPEIKIDGVSSKVEPASGKQKEKISLAVDGKNKISCLSTGRNN